MLAPPLHLNVTRATGTIICQSVRKGPHISSSILVCSTPWALSSCRGNGRLPCSHLHAPGRSSVGAVAADQIVQDELQPQEILSSDDQQDNFAAVLEILKAYDRDFRFHKQPKLKALKLKSIDPVMVLRILKHKEVGPLNKWKFFVWVKKQMRYKHTAETYNAIILNLLELKQFTSIFYSLEDMYKAGISLYPGTCVKMAKSFGRAGMVERAIHALNHMTRLGSPPSARHVNAVVMELLHGKHRYKAYIAYKEMAKFGCEPDLFTFKLLLRALGGEGDVDLGCRVFDDMQTREYEPDAEIAAIATGILCQCGRVDDAIELFEKVKQKGIKFNPTVYNRILSGLSETGNVEKALGVLEEMRSLGYTSERISMASIIDGSGRDEDAHSVVGGENNAEVESSFTRGSIIQ